MTPDILFLFVVVAAAVVLFATEAVSVDVVGLLVLVSLWTSGILDADEALAGFGSQTVVFLAALFVVGAALSQSGVVPRVERVLAGVAARRPRAALLLLTASTGVVSAFLGNTATMVALLPFALGLARRIGVPPSRVLMPLAFASMLGGTCTLIGTSTNVLVSGLLSRWDQPRLSLFELAPVGVPLLGMGLLYLSTVGARLLPDRGGAEGDRWELRSYLSEVRVPEGSPWVGRRIRAAEEEPGLDLRILGRVAGNRKVFRIPFDRAFEAGDILLVEADQETLLRLKDARELDLLGDVRWEASEPRIHVHELLLAPRSALAGRSLAEHDFRRRYGLTVLALHRRGVTRRSRLDRIRLHEGDVLLVQGELDRAEWMLSRGDLLVLDRVELPRRGGSSRIVLPAFAGMLVLGGTGLVPFPLAALGAAVLLLLTRRIRPEQAYSALDGRVLVMVAGLLGLATAMEKTGAGDLLAGWVEAAVGGLGPRWLLAGFYLLTVLLSQPMSNQAAALVVLPVALRTAVVLDLSPRAFAVTVALAASCSFLTPLEPASLVVYGPGRYRFRDFFVVGAPLTALAMALTLLLVPWLWPLSG